MFGSSKPLPEEEAFIAAILAAPRDDTPRLVFADWLEERGDPRGEFLRITVRLEALLDQDPPGEMRAKLRRIRQIAALRQRFRELRDVVPLDWAVRLSRGWIDQRNLRGEGADCPRQWELLRETDNPTIRWCGHCRRNVLYCWSLADVAQAICSDHPLVKALALDPTSPGTGIGRTGDLVE